MTPLLTIETQCHSADLQTGAPSSLLQGFERSLELFSSFATVHPKADS